MNVPDKLVLISGAGGALGKAYIDGFRHVPQTRCVGMMRSKNESQDAGVEWIEKLNLLEKAKTAREISRLNIDAIRTLVFIHTVGKFKFEEEKKPEMDLDEDGIDDEVLLSNLQSFRNVAEPLMQKVRENMEVILCAFGSVSDKYRVPFWNSYTQSKDLLRKYIQYLIKKFDQTRGIFINVSTTNTGNENKLRPFADKTHWLDPEYIASISMSHLLQGARAERWKEIDITHPEARINPVEHYEESVVLERWRKEMGRKSR